MNALFLSGIPLRMKTEALGRAASPLAADGARLPGGGQVHGVTRPTHFRGHRTFNAQRSTLASQLSFPWKVERWTLHAARFLIHGPKTF